MPPETGTTPEVISEDPKGSTGSPSTTSSVVDGKTAVEWKKSYAGLQGAYQKLQETTTAEIAGLNAKLSDAGVKIEELGQGAVGKDTEVSALQKQLADRSQELATLKNEHGSLSSQLARQRLILEEYPDLAQWEAKGLLPTASDPEALKSALGAFRETLKNQVGATVATELSGSSPSGKRETDPSKKTGVTEDRQYILDQMISSAGRDPKSYNEWQKKLDDFDAQQQG